FPEYFLFPLGLAYVTLGLLRQAVLGLLERHDGSLAVLDGSETDHEVEPEEDLRRTAPRPTAFRRGGEE
ncbi:MAG TPA: hypothetical protein VNH46_08700, partial [Gemmatimonadales bacterium]|nr:hypothetical protein [Gemmatimonadales bacterium]